MKTFNGFLTEAKRPKGAVFTFGRFNPPTTGHAKLVKQLQKVAKGLLQFGNGLNIIQNNGETAGQLVFHLHFHLIPRREADGVSIGHWESKKNLDMNKIQENIKSLLNQ